MASAISVGSVAFFPPYLSGSKTNKTSYRYNGRLQYLKFCLFEMCVNVGFVIGCLYSAVSSLPEVILVGRCNAITSYTTTATTITAATTAATATTTTTTTTKSFL